MNETMKTSTGETMNPITPEHENKRPFWRDPQFWLTVFSALLPIIESVLKEAPPSLWTGVPLTVIGAIYTNNLGGLYRNRNDNSARVAEARILAAAPAKMPEIVSAGGNVALGQQPKLTERQDGGLYGDATTYATVGLEPVYIDQTPTGPEGNDFP